MATEELWKSLDDIEQLCKIGLEDIQKCFDIKEDLWQYVEKEIKLNKDLMGLIQVRQKEFDWTKQTPLGGAGTSLNAIVLYCLIRSQNMSYVIETGVSGGYYTAFMMSALDKSIDYPMLTSVELSDDMKEVGKLIPQGIKDLTNGKPDQDELDWNLRTGVNSLDFFNETRSHCADLYSHDSLHTMTHMMKELNEFKKSTTDNFYVFIDDEKSDNFWERCIQMGAFRKPGFEVKYISGKESRLKGHLGGFIQYKKIYKEKL